MRGCGGTKTSIWFVEGPFARAGSSSALTTTLVARDADRREIFAGDTFLEEPAFVLEIVGANIVVAEMHRIATPLAVMVVLQTLKPNALSRLARGWRGVDVAAVREIEKASNHVHDFQECRKSNTCSEFWSFWAMPPGVLLWGVGGS